MLFQSFVWPAVAIAIVAVGESLLQFLIRTALRRRILRLETVILFGSLGAGSWALWRYGPVPSIAWGIAVQCHYICWMIVYFQCKSLASRGYSIRILLDLFHLGRPASISYLKENYGNGMGLNGMLIKRIRSMESLGFLKFDGSTVGPLTPMGKITGWLGLAYRRWLRLDEVG